MVSLNLEIIDALRERSYSAQELAAKFHVNITTVREFMDRMNRTKVIEKVEQPNPKRSGRPPIHYVIHENFARRMPYIKTYKGRDWTILPPDGLLDFYNRPTKSEQAIRNLPVIIANLMHIGYRYSQAFNSSNEVELANATRRLNRELTILKGEFNEQLKAVKLIHDLMKQIQANDEFWDPTTLANFFNIQLAHPSGKPIPPLDITEALAIIEKENEK